MPRGYCNDRISKNFPHPHALHKDLSQREPYTKELNHTLALQRATELRISNEMRPVLDFTRLRVLMLAPARMLSLYACVLYHRAVHFLKPQNETAHFDLPGRTLHTRAALLTDGIKWQKKVKGHF